MAINLFKSNNAVAPKANAMKPELVIAVMARSGNAAIRAYRSDRPNEKYEDTLSYASTDGASNAVYTLVNSAVDIMLKGGFKDGRISVYAPRLSAIRYFSLAGEIGAARRENRPINMENVFAKATGKGYGEEAKQALTELKDTILATRKANCIFRIDDIALAEYYELIVPVGMEDTVTAGKVLNFTNGAAEGGVTVRNYAKFSRQGAVVEMIGKRPCVKKSTKPADQLPVWITRLAEAKKFVEDACPFVERNVSLEELAKSNQPATETANEVA